MEYKIYLSDLLLAVQEGYGFFYVRILDEETGEELAKDRPGTILCDAYYDFIGNNYIVVSISPDEVGGCLQIAVCEDY